MVDEGCARSVKPGRMRAALLGFVVLLMAGGVMAVEEAEYRVVRNDAAFELRKYSSHILAETAVASEFEDAGGEAFRRLFDYISGNNVQRQELAMTAPVAQSSSSRKIAMTSPVGQVKNGGKWTVSFVMPASFTLASTPAPIDPAVVIRAVPERYIAAVRYSGFWSEKAYRRHLLQLQGWIRKSDLLPVGEPIWARYNPPYVPWFLRRNEVLIPVA